MIALVFNRLCMKEQLILFKNEITKDMLDVDDISTIKKNIDIIKFIIPRKEIQYFAKTVTWREIVLYNGNILTWWPLHIWELYVI